MPSRSCATNGCAETVQRDGARCAACRRYLRAAQQRKRTSSTVDIQPLEPAVVEQILTLIDNAVTILNDPRADPRQARPVLYAALAKAEPWRTLRAEIRNWKPLTDHPDTP